MSAAASLAPPAAAMRDAFDRSFAAARPPAPPPGEDLLTIRIRTEPYALRLSEIAALHPDRRITRLPGSPPALRGIAGFRGAIVPVYDLAALLGHLPADEIRWLALAASEPIAFAFTAVEDQLRVGDDAIVAEAAGAWPRRHVRGFLHPAGRAMHPIVDVPSIIEAVRRLVSPKLQSEER
ncbi:MAG TPA: chemotaxis protein CheW [Stellaceae bacterium]|nr:chemotaxis protein CheW [Stellaceae bacterium]